MDKLSKRQRRILAFIGEYASEHGRPPTFREIGAECDISSTSVVGYHLKQLVDAGYLERETGMARGIRVVPSWKRLPEPAEGR